MRRRWLAAVPVFGLVALAACVDLFHGTDFETLCKKSPSDPQCTGATDAAVDATDAQEEADVAAKPIPDFCTWKSDVARKNAELACAWLTACIPPLGANAFGECLMNAQLAYDCTANPNLRPRGEAEKTWGCLATVTSCDEVKRCVFPEGPVTCTSNNDAVTCGSGASAAIHLKCAASGTEYELCQLTGRTCVRPDGRTPSCAAPTNNECTGSTRKCVPGTKIASDCESDLGPDHGLDCGNFGDSQCAQGLGDPACKGTGGAACSNSTDIRCEGSLAKACVGNAEVVIDCSRFGNAPGLPCDESGAIDPPPKLYAPWRRCFATACDPKTQTDKCVGNDTLETCVQGVVRTFACKDNGFGACVGRRCTAP